MSERVPRATHAGQRPLGDAVTDYVLTRKSIKGMNEYFYLPNRTRAPI
jgi:hypothetical protein